MTAPGSLENIFNAVANPKYEFQEKEVPKGSQAFQLVVTDVDKDKHKDDSDNESDNEESKHKKPSKEYMGRRRNTVASIHSNMAFNFHSDLRRMSMIPEERGRHMTLDIPRRGSRARSLSPISEGVLRRNSLAFGSTSERETILR